MILLDTNVLVRITNSGEAGCSVARSAIQKLKAGGQTLVIVPQNLYEFWAVATRRRGPSTAGQNGLGMKPEQAALWINFFRRRFVFLPDRADLPERWQGLVTRFTVVGFRSHDVRLVAAMESYGIDKVLTFNVPDFNRFATTVIDPGSV